MRRFRKGAKTSAPRSGEFMRKTGLTLLFSSLLLLTAPLLLAQQDQPVALKDTPIQQEVITLKAEDGGTS